MSIWSAAAGGGSALGPLLGGFLLEHFWWGSVFLINVPVMVMLVVGGLLLLPESRDPHPGRFDLISAVLSLTAIMPIVYAIKHLAQFGADPTGFVTLLVGVVLALAFVHRQRHLHTPLIDIDLFRNRAFTGSVLANFIAMFALVGLLYFYSQYLQLARGFTPLQAGMAELPTTVASVAVVFLVTRVLARLGEGHTIGFGLVLAALGLAGVAVAEGASSFVWLAMALIPVGLGVGLSQTVATDAIVSAVPAHKAGAASAISETSYELGAALGIAILGSLVNVVYRVNLTPGAVSPDKQDAVSHSLASALHVLDADSPAAQMARDAFTSGMQVTAAAAALITTAAAVIAWRLVPSARR
ncbi:MFS transporter [Acidipropionibacterium acidipropionici]|uniref:MFS transporter n=1 Tax=Acidipropionibacterium acidipropionici TaxID=1748 RepID=UPI002FC67EFB